MCFTASGKKIINCIPFDRVLPETDAPFTQKDGMPYMPWDNVGGYIGSSTRSEIEYAIVHGKPVRYLEQDLSIATSVNGRSYITAEQYMMSEKQKSYQLQNCLLGANLSNLVGKMVIPAGFEPTACRLGERKSVRLHCPSLCRKCLILLGF